MDCGVEPPPLRSAAARRRFLSLEPLAPDGQADHTRFMDQEREDYGENGSRSRRPWTLTQIAILILALLLAAPFVLVAIVMVVWIVNSLAE